MYITVTHTLRPRPPQTKPAGATETGWNGGRALVRALVTIKAGVSDVTRVLISVCVLLTRIMHACATETGCCSGGVVWRGVAVVARCCYSLGRIG